MIKDFGSVVFWSLFTVDVVLALICFLRRDLSR